MKLELKDPPPKREFAPRHVIEPMIAGLKSKAGNWVLIDSYPKESKANVYGTSARLRKSGAEATVRVTDNGYDLYGRWPA